MGRETQKTGIKKINPAKLDWWIHTIGYQVLNGVVSEMCDLPDGVWFADMTLADILDYADDEQHAWKIIEEIGKRYKFEPYAINPYTPIGLIALNILIEGEYSIKE